MFFKNPYLANIAPILMSFFVFGRQILNLFFKEEKIVVAQVAVAEAIKPFLFLRPSRSHWICKSLIDQIFPQSVLIEGAISRLKNRMRNGKRSNSKE